MKIDVMSDDDMNRDAALSGMPEPWAGRMIILHRQTHVANQLEKTLDRYHGNLMFEFAFPR